MKRLGLALLISILGFLPAKADEDAVRDVIASQIDAFSRDDFATAFDHASPLIQHMFRTPKRFGQMVQTGYPMVWRPAGVRFGLYENRDGRIYQYVAFEDAAGRSYLTEYEMIELDSGWKINGVRMLPDASFGA
jgi:hypothetical protein